jgi:hypothetical protein
LFVGAGDSWESGKDIPLELKDLGIVGGMCIVGAGESWDSGRDVYTLHIVELEDDLSRNNTLISLAGWGCGVGSLEVPAQSIFNFKNIHPLLIMYTCCTVFAYVHIPMGI